MKSSPAVANGFVYVGSERRDGVRAERQHWRQDVELRHQGRCVFLRPRWRMGSCMSARTTGRVYALNASTGAKLWSYATGLPVEFLARRGQRGSICRLGGLQTVRAKCQAPATRMWSYDPPLVFVFLACGGERGGYVRLGSQVCYTFGLK